MRNNMSKSTDLHTWLEQRKRKALWNNEYCDEQ